MTISPEQLESLRCCANCGYKIIEKDGLMWHCWKYYRSKTKQRYDPTKNRCKEHKWQEIQLSPKLLKEKGELIS